MSIVFAYAFIEFRRRVITKEFLECANEKLQIPQSKRKSLRSSC